jgi:hypothetical protein
MPENVRPLMKVLLQANGKITLVAFYLISQMRALIKPRIYHFSFSAGYLFYVLWFAEGVG